MKCQACSKGILKQKTKPQVFTYKDKSITLAQSGLWCDSCEEGILSGEDIAKTEKAFDEFKSKVDGLLRPEEIRHIRKDLLKLSQEWSNYEKPTDARTLGLKFLLADLLRVDVGIKT